MLIIKDAKRTRENISRNNYMARLTYTNDKGEIVAIDSKIFNKGGKAFQWLIDRMGKACFYGEAVNPQKFNLIIIAPDGEVEDYTIEAEED